jgi:hypothetical protein
MIIVFYLRLSWNFLLKDIRFYVSKMLEKKIEFVLFFSLIQINIFWYFCIILMCWYKKSILKIKKILSQYIFKKIYFKNNHYVIINIIARILVRVSQWVNNNFLFKCKDIWVGLKARNVFASSLSSNKIFSAIAPWIVHSRAAPNTLATNFIPFNFFSF